MEKRLLKKKAKMQVQTIGRHCDVCQPYWYALRPKWACTNWSGRFVCSGQTLDPSQHRQMELKGISCALIESHEQKGRCLVTGQDLPLVSWSVYIHLCKGCNQTFYSFDSFGGSDDE